MNPLDLRAAVLAYLKTNWTRTPVYEQNVGRSVVKTSHVVFNFNPAPTRALEILGATDRTGVFIIQVFTPLNVGENEALGHAGRIESLFRNGWVGSIAFEPPPYTRPGSVNEEQQMYQINVVVPFEVITE